MTRKINAIVVHCSASDFGCVNIIDDWHEKENKWSDIGYHRVITNGTPYPGALYDPIGDGAIEYGRDERKQGSHAKEVNSESLGVCLIGKGGLIGSNTESQLYSLKTMCHWWMIEYGLSIDAVVGHYEVTKSGKTCPDLDMVLVRAFISTADRSEEDRLISEMKKRGV